MKHLSILFFFLSVASINNAQTIQIPKNNYIQVIGEGEHEVIPDEIYILVRISDDKETDVEDKQTELIKGLVAAGVNQEEITLYNEGAHYGRLTWNRKEVMKSMEFSIMVTDAEEVNKVFKELDKQEVSSAYIYELDYSKREEIERMVRIEAVSNAKLKAEDILSAVGSAVGVPIKVEEQFLNKNGNQYDNNYTLNDAYYYQSGKSISGMSNKTKISFKKLKFTYSVNCWFEIK